MINRPPPFFKGPNLRIPILIPIKGRGGINLGSGLFMKGVPKYMFVLGTCFRGMLWLIVEYDILCFRVVYLGMYRATLQWSNMPLYLHC